MVAKKLSEGHRFYFVATKVAPFVEIITIFHFAKLCKCVLLASKTLCKTLQNV